MAKKRFRPNVINWFFADDPLFGPGSGLNDYRILAEGDSWFSLGGIPTSNLLFSLRFRRSTLIVNCAQPGDTIRRMAVLAQDRALRDALTAGVAWDLLLLSGGGNDLIDAADEILLSPQERNASPGVGPGNYCDPGELDNLMRTVQEGYRTIVALRDGPDSTARGKPILTHTYDYITPRNAPARFLLVPLLGPWLFKALTEAAVPEADWHPVSDYLTDRLAEAILALRTGANPLPDFHVVDTRGTLTRAKAGDIGESGDWMNEIHPSIDGYKKLARPLTDGLERRLPHS